MYCTQTFASKTELTLRTLLNVFISYEVGHSTSPGNMLTVLKFQWLVLSSPCYWHADIWLVVRFYRLFTREFIAVIKSAGLYLGHEMIPSFCRFKATAPLWGRLLKCQVKRARYKPQVFVSCFSRITVSCCSSQWQGIRYAAVVLKLYTSK